MMRILIPFIAALSLTGPATAAVFEFDLWFFMETTGTPRADYEVAGTFTFDDTTGAVSDVAVSSGLFDPSTPFAYAIGSYDSGQSEFTFGALNGITLSFGVTSVDWARLAVNETAHSIPIFFTERDSSNVVLGEGVDPSLTVTRLADPIPQMPLPAGLPLLLAGLGAFALVRRGARKG